MLTQSKNQLLNRCKRRSHPLQPTSIRAGTVRKSHKVVASTAKHSVQGGVSDMTPLSTIEIPATSMAKVDDIIDIEWIQVLTSNSSVATHKQHQKDICTESETESTSVAKNEERQIFLIEGNKAITVYAKRWPTRPHMNVFESYKLPHPRLSPNELRLQTRLVNERKRWKHETHQERIKGGSMREIYCLPKRLIVESRARLALWYQLPNEKNIGNNQAEKEMEAAPAKSKSESSKELEASSLTAPSRASVAMQAGVSTAAPTRASTAVAETSTVPPEAASTAEKAKEGGAKPKAEPMDAPKNGK